MYISLWENYRGHPDNISFMQFSTKIDGFERKDSQGFENSYNSYEQYPLEKFFIFTIYQNYTLALKPQDSFGEFNNFFLIFRKCGKSSENTIRPSCNCLEWHTVMQYCPMANYHYVHNLWQSVQGDSEHFYVLVIYWKWKHFGANC